MSDMTDMFQGLKGHNKRLRKVYGVDCPECVRLLPKANPSVLLPQQVCRIHKYRDERPELTDEQYEGV